MKTVGMVIGIFVLMLSLAVSAEEKSKPPFLVVYGDPGLSGWSCTIQEPGDIPNLDRYKTAAGHSCNDPHSMVFNVDDGYKIDLYENDNYTGGLFDNGWCGAFTGRGHAYKLSCFGLTSIKLVDIRNKER